jgi:2Fe-2S ferredoxin
MSRRAPKGTYRVRFLPDGVTVEVDPERIPYGQHGLAGSILDVGLGNGVELEHACGGFGACGTCHVIVREGMESCGEPSEQEQDRLDQVFGVTPESRLGCQCVPDGSCDLVVEIPQ